MKQLSVRAAALRFGRLDDYWMREWSHQAVHGGDVAWMTYLERRGDRIGVFAKTGDPQALASAIGFSTESFVKASAATFEMLDWTFPETASSDWKSIADAAEAGRPRGARRSPDAHSELR